MKQFRRLGSQVNYALCLLPDFDTMRRHIAESRRVARENRVLLYYNGHDVPRPSARGEIWVFNDRCTEYLPVPMAHLESWLGAPAVLVFDCSYAEVPLREYLAAAAARRARTGTATTATKEGEDDLGLVMFGACSAKELLPLNPSYPADIFTACMTSPLRTALLWFCNNSALRRVDASAVEMLPGPLGDRTSPLGELNWIFTTVTDTIAWTTLPRAKFQKYFRQDSQVATLFRNFLLAERVLRGLGCTPVSHPKLPPTARHALWESWDMAVDMCLMQLDALCRGAAYVPSTFFVEQLRAFEVWLEFRAPADCLDARPAEHLPIVLQVLLGKSHRAHVLALLARFLDLGPWAVLQSLSVGVCPYIYKLLGNDDPDLRHALVFIWTKILAFDDTPQGDFVRNREYCFFIETLSSSTPIPVDNNIFRNHHNNHNNNQDEKVKKEGDTDDEEEEEEETLDIRVMAAFVMSVLITKLRVVREECLNNNFLQMCLSLIAGTTPRQAQFRLWLTLCLAKLWDGTEQGTWTEVHGLALGTLHKLITDPAPEVRAAAVYALGTLISPTPRSTAFNDARTAKELDIALHASIAVLDASPLVRREVVVLFSRLFSGHFPICSPTLHSTILSGDSKYYASSSNSGGSGSGSGSNSSSESDTTAASAAAAAAATAYLTLWRGLQLMRRDPQVEVSTLANQLSTAICRRILRSEILPPRPPLPVKSKRRGDMSAMSPMPRSRFLFGLSGSTNGTAAASTPVSCSVPVGHSSLRQSVLGSAAATSASAATTTTTTTTTVGGGQQEGTTTGSSPPSTGCQWRCSEDNEDDEGGTLVMGSVLYQWCCEYWKQPLLRAGTVDRTSPLYQRQERERAARAAQYAEARESCAVWARSTKEQFREISVLSDPDVQPTMLLFHPFESQLLAAGTGDRITVWDILQAEKVRVFSNQNQGPTRVTSMLFTNEDADLHLVTGSSDGIVRVWRDFGARDAVPRLVTSWRAHPQLLSVENGSGLLLDWQPATGRLLAAGDATNVLLWDMATESIAQDIPTQSAFSVTALSFNRFAPSLFAAGCGDYTLALFDLREPPRAACVMALRAPQPNITNPILRTGFSSATKLISAALNQIRIWDITKPTPLMTFPDDGLVAFDLHRRAPLMASGSSKQHIRVYNQNGEMRLDMKYHTGLYGRRIAAVSTLALHPHRLLLAAGLADASTCVFSFEHQKT